MMSSESLKSRFIFANSNKPLPVDANMLYEMFLTMKKNEFNSYVDIYEDISNVAERSIIIDDYISYLIKQTYVRYRDLPEIYRVIRFFDYLSVKSSYVTNLDIPQLSKLPYEIRKVLICHSGSEMLEQIPDLRLLLNDIIIYPPTIYDFFLFYCSIIPLTKSERTNIKFLCLMLLHNINIYKYSSSMIALSLIDIVMSSRNNYDNRVIYLILDEYCCRASNIYKNCLVDMLIFFTPTLAGHVVDKHVLDTSSLKCSITLTGICKQIKTCINSVPAKVRNNTFTVNYSHNTHNVLTVNEDLHIFDKKPQRGSAIGNGSYGTVYKLELDEKLVMKKLVDGESMIEFIKVTNLNHSCISRVSAICKTHTNILFYERASCDLQKYVLSIDIPMNKRLIRSYMLQLIKAVSYCHCNMIAHLDIKPNNIILHTDGRIELIDFGTSCNFNPFIEEFCSDVTTRLYCPPENLLGFERYYSHVATDMWSIGICMAFMLSMGKMQYFQALLCDDNIIIHNINDLCLYSSWKDIIPDISPSEEDFLSSLLKYDPRERINTLQALSHPYLN